MSGKLLWARDSAYYARSEWENVKNTDKIEAAYFLARINSARTNGPSVVSADEVVGGKPFYCYSAGTHSIVYTVDDVGLGADVTVIGVCLTAAASAFLANDAPNRFANLP